MTEAERNQANVILMLETDMAVSKRVVEIMGANIDRMLIPRVTSEFVAMRFEEALANNSGFRNRLIQQIAVQTAEYMRAQSTPNPTWSPSCYDRY